MSDDEDANSEGDIDSGEERERREIERRFRPAFASQSSAVRENVQAKAKASEAMDYATMMKLRAKEEWEWASKGAGAASLKEVRPVTTSQPKPVAPAVSQPRAVATAARDESAPPTGQQRGSAQAAPAIPSHAATSPKRVAPSVEVKTLSVEVKPAAAMPPPPPKSEFEKMMDLIEREIRQEDALRARGRTVEVADDKSAAEVRQPSQHFDPVAVPRRGGILRDAPDPAAVADIHRKLTAELRERRESDASFYRAAQALEELLTDDEFRGALLRFVDGNAVAAFRANAAKRDGGHTHQEFAAFKAYARAVESRVDEVVRASLGTGGLVDGFFERLMDEGAAGDDDDERSLLSIEAWELLLAALKFECFCDLVESRADLLATTERRVAAATTGAAANVDLAKTSKSTAAAGITPPRPPVQPRASAVLPSKSATDLVRKAH